MCRGTARAGRQVGEPRLNCAKSSMSVEREVVHGSCPSCGASGLRSYPVLSEGGWFLVVKCQECLTSLQRTPWNKYGYITRDEAIL